MDDMIEDHNPQSPSQTPTTIDNVHGFQSRGETSKHDKLGILDENTKIRQNLVRLISGKEGMSNDVDMMNLMLKAMKDNDAQVIATARISVDEESNASNEALARSIALQAGLMQAPIKAETDLLSGSNRSVRDVEIPPSDKEFVPGEMDVGTNILSESDLMNVENINPDESED